MEFKITTQQTLKILYVISWIMFLGVCIEPGSYIFNGIFTQFNPNAADYFKLTDLYRHDNGYFLVLLLIMTIAGILKAIIFYLIVVLLKNNKLNMVSPFNRELYRFILGVSVLSVGIGIFSNVGVGHVNWFSEKGVNMPNIEVLNLDGGDVWLFMAAILFVIAQICKRGIEIQAENDLTI